MLPIEHPVPFPVVQMSYAYVPHIPRISPRFSLGWYLQPLPPSWCGCSTSLPPLCVNPHGHCRHRPPALQEVHDALASIEGEAERMCLAERQLLDGDAVERDRLYARAEVRAGRGAGRG